jgi:hypothetical protein
MKEEIRKPMEKFPMTAEGHAMLENELMHRQQVERHACACSRLSHSMMPTRLGASPVNAIVLPPAVLKVRPAAEVVLAEAQRMEAAQVRFKQRLQKRTTAR